MLSFTSRSIYARVIGSRTGSKVPKRVSVRSQKNLIQDQKSNAILSQTLSSVFMSKSAMRRFSVVSRHYCNGVKSTQSTSTPKKKNQPQPVTIGHLDIRVGRIVHVARHPHADTLYVEKIDVGEPAPRTIISGLVKYMTEADLKSKLVLVLCNLPSKEMRSIASHGMVLAASTTIAETGETKVALIEPPQNSNVGEAVFVDGEVPEAIQGISGNKLEKILKKCKVDADGIATFTTSDGLVKPIQTASGSCTSSLHNAPIS